MASIKKMGNKYYVYYYHPFMRGANGKLKQLYESYYDEEKAVMRKYEIEYQIKSGYFRLVSYMSVEDYFKLKYIPMYCAVKWKYKSWDTNMCYWNNDILPYFGKKPMSQVTPADIEKFILLMRTKRVRNRPKTPEAKLPHLSETTIRYVYTLLHCFFKKAVQWDDLEKSTVKCEKPKAHNAHRNYWQPERFYKALDSVEDEMLHLAIHMAFRCTLRIGELCAIRWEDVDFEANKISVNKTLQRITLDALNKLPHNEVIHIFAPTMQSSKSRLILTSPKSEFGIRVNGVSNQLCEELMQWKRKIMLARAWYGEQYHDHDLVFCNQDGRPIDPQRLSRLFVLWQQEFGVGDINCVDFHSIRISSTSLKLAVSGGDIKSVQKDLGDKTAHMVLSTYSRSLDTQYESMNQKFDQYFYKE